METKKCNKCGRELTIDNFHKKHSSKDGLQYYCKECHNQSVRQSYNKNKEKKKQHKIYTNEELAKFTPRELLQELKSRGYVWDKMSYTQFVDYNKI